ncbi:MAG: heme-binding protein [Coprobacillus sp.]
MDDLLSLEQIYNYDEFTNQDALEFGLCAIQIIKQEHLKNIRIRVKHHNDIVFQFLMNGKAGEMWLDRKENTVLKSGHSSLYVFQHQDIYQDMIDNDEYAICGGGFPLIENNQVTGVFCISGLSHEEDHDLIIRSLIMMKEKGEKL